MVEIARREHQLERYIAREKNPELKAALEDLNEFLFC